MSDRCGDCECCAVHKEELANRDMQWWEALAGVDVVAPTPEAVKAWQLSLQDLAREQALDTPLVRGCIEVVAEINRRWGATSYADAVQTLEKLLAPNHEPCWRRARLKRHEADQWLKAAEGRIADLQKAAEHMADEMERWCTYAADKDHVLDRCVGLANELEKLHTPGCSNAHLSIANCCEGNDRALGAFDRARVKLLEGLLREQRLELRNEWQSNKDLEKRISKALGE